MKFMKNTMDWIILIKMSKYYTTAFPLAFWCLKLVWTAFMNSLPTLQKTYCVSNTRTNWSTLFMETLALYSKTVQNHRPKCHCCQIYSVWWLSVVSTLWFMGLNPYNFLFSVLKSSRLLEAMHELFSRF